MTSFFGDWLYGNDAENTGLPAIVGHWTYAKLTSSYERHGSETPMTFWYEDWLTPQVLVYADGNFRVVIYGSTVGTLVQIGRHEFLATNLVHSSEGETWQSEYEHWFRYDPESGLLRYTWFTNSYSGRYIHYYFKRDSNVQVRK